MLLMVTTTTRILGIDFHLSQKELWMYLFALRVSNGMTNLMIKSQKNLIPRVK